MKKLLTIIAVCAMIFCTGCSKKAEVSTGETSLIAQKYAPENSVAFLRFSSVEKLFATFSVKPESVMGEPVSEDRSEITDVLGFDPMNIAEYDKKGFDTKREFGLVISSFKADSADAENSQINIGFLLPVKDKNSAYKYIKETLEKNNEKGMVINDNNGMLSITKTDEQNFLVTIKPDDNYMVFSFSLNSKETADIYFNAQKHLGDTPYYKEVSGSVNLSSDIAFYADLRRFFNDNALALNNMTATNPMFQQNELSSVAFLKFYRGFGITADLSKSDLVINAVSFVDTENPFNKLIGNIKTDKSVILDFEKNPAVLLAVMINAAEYLNFYLETVPADVKNDFESSIAETNQALGIDIRKDLIDQLAGSINLGIYDGAGVNMMQYNTVLNFNIRNRQSFIDMIEKTKATTGITLIDQSQYEQLFQVQPSKDVNVYSVFMGIAAAYIVIEKDNVSLITTKDMVADLLNKSNPRSIDKADKSIVDKLRNDQNYLFIDFAEAYLAGKNLYQMYLGFSGGENILDAKADNFAKNFDYLYAGGNYKGEKATAEFIVKTKFTKPFFVALQEEIEKLKAAPQ